MRAGGAGLRGCGAGAGGVPRLRAAGGGLHGGVRMADVDLRGAVELDIARGVDALAGAVISPGQLFDLAPALAAQMGVRVVG
ncbi:hypothetical protein GCM10020254_47090 [Streptomyces goshikiensis]